VAASRRQRKTSVARLPGDLVASGISRLKTISKKFPTAYVTSTPKKWPAFCDSGEDVAVRGRLKLKPAESPPSAEQSKRNK
jgi:hypothetical protein